MKPPHIKAQREKEFRKNVKRQQELYREIRELGYIKLEQPIRHGWFKEMIITDGVNRYKHAEAIIEVYQKIKTSYWGATKEKAQKAWDEDRSRYMLTKDKPTISRKSYNKLSDKAKDLCVFFRYREERTDKKKTRFYVNFPAGCVQINFKRSYITHRKRIDPALEAELAYLENQLLKPGFYELISGGIWNRWSRISKSFERKKETHRVKENLRKLRGKSIITIMNYEC